MNHSTPTFTERLRVALGLGPTETPSAATEPSTRPRGTHRQRGEVFADRLRKALDG